MTESLHSAIYRGRLVHARVSPRRHSFAVPLYLLYLDLDELETMRSSWLFGVERARPLSFRRKDYLGNADRPLADEVRRVVAEALGRPPTGPIRMLTHVRAFGYVFNPVTFYYCFAEDQGQGEHLEAVAAEITNTPWGERHTYVLPAEAWGARASFDKAFHVSPFFPMEQRYRWRFTAPAERLRVDMQNREEGTRVFSARLDLNRQPFTEKNLLAVAAAHPMMALSVHAAIYWHAFRLWRKGVPFFAHPRNPRSIEEHHGKDREPSTNRRVPAHAPRRAPLARHS